MLYVSPLVPVRLENIEGGWLSFASGGFLACAFASCLVAFWSGWENGSGEGVESSVHIWKKRVSKKEIEGNFDESLLFLFCSGVIRCEVT